MKVLDLFCGAGGSAVGLHRAGFEVIGVDVNEQSQYPYPQYIKDVFELDLSFFNDFDLIWASPPCQAFSFGTEVWRNRGRKYPDHISKTRELLLRTKKPFIIENLTRSPIRNDIVLCGVMFGLNVLRHRAFEIELFKIKQPTHIKHKGTAKDGPYTTVAGHGQGKGRTTLKAWQEAMGIDWITDKKMLAEAIPPAYSEYIGTELKKLLGGGK